MSYWMLGLQALQMVGGLQAEREQAKMRNKLNQVQNKVRMASAFDSVSAIVRNKTSAYMQSQEVAFALQREELATAGAHDAQAGAAGVTGQSNKRLACKLLLCSRNARDRRCDCLGETCGPECLQGANHPFEGSSNSDCWL